MAHLYVAAAHKSSGKTSVTVGLTAALVNRGLTVQPFKKGPFYSAVRADVRVVPVAVNGTGAVLAKGAPDMAPDVGRPQGPRRVRVHIGKPLAPKQDESESKCAADLRDRTRAAVVEMHRALAEAGERSPAPSPDGRP